MRRRIVVSADVPGGVPDEDVAAYVSEALASWGGSLRPPGAYGADDPGHPLFGGVTVRSVAMRGTDYRNE
jgi:hypothetical protein